MKMKKFLKKHANTIAFIGGATIGLGGSIFLYRAGVKAGRELGYQSTLNWLDDYLPELQVSYNMRKYFESLAK